MWKNASEMVEEETVEKKDIDEEKWHGWVVEETVEGEVQGGAVDEEWKVFKKR